MKKYLLSIGFLSVLFACTKTEEDVFFSQEDALQISARVKTEILEDSIAEPEYNVPAEGFVYAQPYGIERNCGCVPPVSVEIVTGVPVIRFQLSEMYGPCRGFNVAYTINGSSYEEKSFELDRSIVTNVRLSYGQSCEGEVTVSCLSPACDVGGPCMRRVLFSLQEGGGSVIIPGGDCGKYYKNVKVKVPQSGAAVVTIERINTADKTGMVPTAYSVCHLDGYIEREVGTGTLVLGENRISFPTSGRYLLKMYNRNECGVSGEHYLKYDVSFVSPNEWEPIEVRNH